MTADGPRRLSDLVRSGELARLGAEARSRRELTGRARAGLPADEAGHLVSASLDAEGRLVLGMDSAAWAARLRYSTTELLGRRVRVRVAAPGETATDGEKP